MQQIDLSDVAWIVGGLVSFCLLAAVVTRVPWARVGLFIMSHFTPVTSADRSTDLVHVPVRRTDTEGAVAAVVPHSAMAEIPDTNAPEAGTEGWELPRVSTKLTDDSLVVMLAAQRTPAGRWRFSANKIFELVGGSRAAVLAQVKEVQQGTPPAEFPPLTAAQAEAREQLELPKR